MISTEFGIDTVALVGLLASVYFNFEHDTKPVPLDDNIYSRCPIRDSLLFAYFTTGGNGMQPVGLNANGGNAPLKQTG
jgi:hypothetical protein